VSRRVHDLTLAALHDLPSPCRACVFWESRDGGRGGGPDPRAGTTAKEAWWQATQLEWGTPGKAVYVDDHLVGFAVFAPSTHFPRARILGPAFSEDALLLATLWVDPAYEGMGLATSLLQSVLRETHRRGARALEAYGDRQAVASLDGGHPSGCVIPESWLLRVGFAVHQDHYAFPLLRLDLRQTVRWQESVGHALEGVIGILSRRERAPVPVQPAVGRPSKPEATAAR
jgi:GNAT superfamily N-acetyltransferase